MALEFTKDKIIWTKAMNLDLAKFLENKPHIWDPRHPKFSHIGLRDETFAEFAAEYDISWQAVKDRWTNIRSTFGFYMRKVNARKNTGKEFKVGWFMWKPCKYLYKVHKSKPLKNTEEGTTDEHEVSNDQDIFSDNSEDEKDNITCKGIVNNIAVVLQGVKNGSFELQRSRYASVGESVTTMLSQLDSYEAAQLSQKILEILAEYDEKNPMNPNGLRYVGGSDRTAN